MCNVSIREMRVCAQSSIQGQRDVGKVMQSTKGEMQIILSKSLCYQLKYEKQRSCACNLRKNLQFIPHRRTTVKFISFFFEIKNTRSLQKDHKQEFILSVLANYAFFPSFGQLVEHHTSKNLPFFPRITPRAMFFISSHEQSKCITHRCK